MATVVVALGSNIGDRLHYLSAAKKFLQEVSDSPPACSSVYITEPVGPSDRDFFNAVVCLSTGRTAETLLNDFKTFEQSHGREPDHPRWSARTIDLDIISYDNLVIQTDNLIIPHPEYDKRLFVLKPLEEIMPSWRDPRTGISIEQLVSDAPEMRLTKTELRW